VALFNHLAGGRLRHDERSDEIYVDDLPHFLQWKINEIVFCLNARIVYDNVEFPKRFYGLGNQVGDLLGIGDVGADGDYASPNLFDVGNGRVSNAGRADVIHNDRGAFFGETNGNRLAYAS
jgi:hypothetical protein